MVASPAKRKGVLYAADKTSRKPLFFGTAFDLAGRPCEVREDALEISRGPLNK